MWESSGPAQTQPPQGQPVGHIRVNIGQEQVLQASVLKRQEEGE